MHWLEHVEAAILYTTPFVAAAALFLDFSATNLILYCVLLVLWKQANGAL